MYVTSLAECLALLMGSTHTAVTVTVNAVRPPAVSVFIYLLRRENEA